jgi:murein DD-endopeptidase MepM/ murein hydrolase activator NlpD
MKHASFVVCSVATLTLGWVALAAFAHAGTPHSRSASRARSPVGPAADGQRAGPFVLPSGSGSFERRDVPCLTVGERRRIELQIASSQRVLGLNPMQAQPQVLFDWPLRAVGSAAAWFDVHAIGNFVDQDQTAGNILDYECGPRTYDGHRGIDIVTWPFGWTLMDDDEVQIIAAASGVIVLKVDGNGHNSCAPGGTANVVCVQHDDGSVAWYAHMKKFSLTPKLVGQAVARGEYLGVVGSSGSSTYPHLHLEVHDKFNNLIEPFSGPCNSMNPDSWWRDQRPYYDSAVNRLMVGDAAVFVPPCPGRAITNEVDALPRGTLGFFTVFYHDLLSGQVGDFKILRPAGTTFRSWSHASTDPHSAVYGWQRSWNIPNGAPTGTWTYQVTFQGQTYAMQFEVI